MRATGFFWALSMALVGGCGGTVQISSGTGGEGGGATTTSTTTATTGGGGATTTSTDTGTTITTTVDDGCPDAPGDVFWLDVEVGGEKFHLTSACPNYNQPYGPMAYAMTNGKGGPQWYFVISACLDGIPEGSSAGPSLYVQAEVPDHAMLSTPYDTVGDIAYVTSDQTQLAPAMSPSIVFNQFGDVHSVVTGKFTGTVTWTDGQPATIYGQFSVCRRGDVIYI